MRWRTVAVMLLAGAVGACGQAALPLGAPAGGAGGTAGGAAAGGVGSGTGATVSSATLQYNGAVVMPGRIEISAPILPRTTVIYVETDREQRVGGYESWWDVPVAETSEVKGVEDAYRKVIAACKKHGKHPGMGGVYETKLMEKYIGMGMRFILSGGDLSFLLAGAKALAKVSATPGHTQLINFFSVNDAWTLVEGPASRDVAAAVAATEPVSAN